MTRYATIPKFAIGLIAGAGFAAWAVAATPPPGLDTPASALSPAGLDGDRPAVPLTQQAPTGNPLWGIPLRVLTVTRERPLFSPSRRPPAPPVVAAPPAPRPVAVVKPPEPDHPLLTIVGTIVGSSDAIAVFIEQATNNIIRLHTGQDHDGWVLRSVHGREATFEKKELHATLALPAPGAAATPGPALAPIPPQPIQAGMSNPPMHAAMPNQPIPAALPAVGAPGNTWVDGDGNLITPPKGLQAVGRAH